MQKQINVSVRTSDGKTLELVISTNDTTTDVKQKIQDSEGIAPLDQQRLLYAGKVMMDDLRTVSELYKIKYGDTLHVIPRVSGGGWAGPPSL